MFAPLRRLAGFLRFVLRRWSEDRCPQIAGSLTYTTLLALVPTFAIAVAMLSSAPFTREADRVALACDPGETNLGALYEAAAAPRAG